MALRPLRVGHSNTGFDDRMAVLRERLRQTQDESNACARDFDAIARAHGGLIPDEMLSGRAGETGELLRKALAREERLARELERAKAVGARALEREQDAMYVRLRQQEIHATLLAAAHDESERTGAQTKLQLSLLRSKADALESRNKELEARAVEDEHLMRWDLELARRERDAARLQLEYDAAQARERALRALEIEHEEEMRQQGLLRSGADTTEGTEKAAHHSWDFSGLQPAADTRLLRSGVRHMREALEAAPREDEWRERFHEQLVRVEALVDEIARSR